MKNGSIVFQAGGACVFSTACSCCELRWRYVVQAAVRPVLVVLSAPVGDDPPGLEQVLEPADAQAFLAHLAVEALHVCILRGLTKLDVNQIDLAIQSPGREWRLVSSGLLSHRIARGRPRSAMIWSSTRVTRRPAKLVSTYMTRLSRVYASITLSTRIERPAFSTSCTKSSAHSWSAAVYTPSGVLTRTQCFRFFRRRARAASR